jgi:hypothetical protein
MVVRYFKKNKKLNLEHNLKNLIQRKYWIKMVRIRPLFQFLFVRSDWTRIFTNFFLNNILKFYLRFNNFFEIWKYSLIKKCINEFIFFKNVIKSGFDNILSYFLMVFGQKTVWNLNLSRYSFENNINLISGTTPQFKRILNPLSQIFFFGHKMYMTVNQQIQKYFSVDSFSKFVSISSIYGWKWLNISKTLPNLSSEF